MPNAGERFSLRLQQPKHRGHYLCFLRAMSRNLLIFGPRRVHKRRTAAGRGSMNVKATNREGSPAAVLVLPFRGGEPAFPVFLSAPPPTLSALLPPPPLSQDVVWLARQVTWRASSCGSGESVGGGRGKRPPTCPAVPAARRESGDGAGQTDRLPRRSDSLGPARDIAVGGRSRPIT